MTIPVIAYRRQFAFAIPPTKIWEAIERVERFEGWWSWLEEFRLDGGELREGAVLHGVVAPPLPYRMRVDVELTRCERPALIDSIVRGDLEGEAALRIRPDGAGSQVEVAWTIEMMQRPMRVASRVAHPLLKWGHDRVVELTVAGFRRHVEVDD
ncbi:MAG: SRPBCC family protein [Acidimicrobiales bacterium]